MAFLGEIAGAFGAFGLTAFKVDFQQLPETEDRVHWRTKLVTHPGEEFTLCLVRPVCLDSCLFRLFLGPLPFLELALQISIAAPEFPGPLFDFAFELIAGG